jgi:parvulin-like peptidyl-prolyl isomerase
MKNIGLWMIRFVVTLLPGMVILLSSGCEVDRTVAVVGNERIRESEFLKSYIDSRQNTTTWTDTDSLRRQHLNRMIRQSLKVQDAMDKQLHQVPPIQAQLQKKYDEMLYRTVLDRLVLDRVAPESELRKMYNRYKTEVQLWHIFIPFDTDTTETAAQGDGEHRLQTARQEWFSGIAFEALARKYSQDPLSRGQGGYIGFVGWGDRGYGESFYQNVFKLTPGRLSPVIRSEKGYHLCKVENQRERGLPPYNVHKERIRNNILKEKSPQLKEQFDRVGDELSKKYDLTFHESVLDPFIVWYLQTRSDTTAQKRSLLQQFQSLEASWAEAALFSFRGGEYKLERFVGELDQIPYFRRPPLTSDVQLKNLLSNIAPYHLFLAFARDQHVAESESFKRRYQGERDRLLAREVERRLQARIRVDEQEVEEWLDAHKESLATGKESNVQQIVVQDHETAQRVIEEAVTTPFDQLYARYSTDTDSRHKDGELGFITPLQYGDIGLVAARMDIGEISDPIKTGNKYTIIKVVDRRDAGIEFDKNKIQIRRKLYEEKSQTAMQEWMSELTERYTVIRYWDVVSEITI